MLAPATHRCRCCAGPQPDAATRLPWVDLTALCNAGLTIDAALRAIRTGR